jgi:subtilisin family serine protease
MGIKSLDSKPFIRKLQPKLRMIANGSEGVNVARSEFCAGLTLVGELAAKKEGAPPVRAQAIAQSGVDLPKPARGHQRKVPDNVMVNVFVQTTDEQDRRGKVHEERGRRGNVAIASVPLAELDTLAQQSGVSFVEMGEPLTAPTPLVLPRRVTEKDIRRPPLGDPARHEDGEGVLIGIVDVQGFDFSHPDFLDANGQTRFISIWDQGGENRPGPKWAGFKAGDGSEITATQMNAALGAAKSVGAPATELEPQSQMVPGSHGTHVASIAAGNHGMCKRAKIAAVLIALPADEVNDRRMSFYDSTRLADAVDYLFRVAEREGLRVSINISLGTNGHAHDASAAVNRWIDSALAIPGRSVCVAAGNAGQEDAQFEGDFGYVMGRIHTSGQIPARGLSTDIDWIVVGNGTADLSENELEIWYGAQDRFQVQVRPPNGGWLPPISPRQALENHQLDDGSFISIYNEVYHPANGSNYIAIYLSPFLSQDPAKLRGVLAGTWTVRLHGLEVRNGRYHGWIERDDPRRIGRIGTMEAWRFPSFFGTRSNVDDSSVSSLACGQRLISVANLDDVNERMNVTSSQGPTRDGRFKPDVAAPGTDIVAARGFAGPKDRWVAMTGTSMAAPYVTGLVGLMLAVEPRLTAAQIEGIIQRTARPLPGASFSWINDAGFGRIDPELCLLEAAAANTREDVKP